MVLGFVVTVFVMRTAFSKDIGHNTESIKHNNDNVAELFKKTDALEMHKLSKGDFRDWKDDMKTDMRDITGSLNTVNDKLDRMRDKE